MGTKKIAWIGIVIVIVIIAVTLHFIFRPHQLKTPPHSEFISVSVVHPVAAQWRQPLHLIATTADNSIINVSAELSGRITQINFNPQQYVHKGQLLLTVFNKNLEANIKSAKVNLENSKKQFERLKQLAQSNNTSIASLDDARRTYASDKAHLAEQEALLKRSRIFAPLNGYISFSNYSLGEYIKSGDVITTIRPHHDYAINFSVPAHYVNDLKIGDAIYLKSEKMKKPLQAKLTAIDNKVNSDNQTVKVRAEVKKSLSAFKAGQAVPITLYVGRANAILVLPQTALYYELGGAYVYIVKANKAQQVPVKVLQIREREAGVTGKLSEQDQVVSINNTAVHKGALLQVINK